MSVNFEVKGMLARLLATEDIIIEHKNVETACFNVHTRVLTLPMWERASNTVYDMLVGHEVGHALYTPNEDWTKIVKIPGQFVNVVEDVRIEKLMKRRYAGIAKIFFNAYKELNEQDFFQLNGENVSNFNLADRANLYFKVGNFLPLDFSPEEKEIIDLISSVETFSDTLIAAEKLYSHCKKEKEQNKVDSINSPQKEGDAKSPTNDISEQENNDDEIEEGQSNQSESTQEQSAEESKPAEGNQNQSIGGNHDDPEVRTVNSLDEKIRDLVNFDAIENVYVEVPNLNLGTVVAKNEDIHKEIDFSFEHQQKSHNEVAKSQGFGEPKSLYELVDQEFRNFKISAQKEVNYLVKEFECRKAADSYARSSTSRTGVLDTSRLHFYKYSEDLFKKVSVIPDGKNHGLVFVLDWSGSMSDVIVDTCKQLFNLIWFCKKVAIPFEVYSFTNEWRRGEYDYVNSCFKAADRTPHYTKKQNILCVSETFSMMNILTSKVSSRELNHQMLNIWRLACCFSNMYRNIYTYPSRLCLSGTPLNEALVTLHQILPKFQKENKLQKIQCIVLTDGEANPLPYHVEVKRNAEQEMYMGTRGINPGSTFLRDRKLGTIYKISRGYHKFTDALLNNLKDNFPFINFIGIRVLESRSAHQFINLYHPSYDKQYDKIQSDWKKMRSFMITESGYDVYFGLSSTALSQESEFNVNGKATKTQIKSAFVKSLKTKKLNKKVLGEFISFVV